MASIDRSDPIILSHVLAEHRDLFSRITAIRSGFNQDASCPEHVACVTDSVRSLRDHLRDHFAQEEQGGFLEESVARMPRLAAAAKAIMGQHPSLLAELDKVLACLSSSGGGAESWQRAGQDFEVFAAHMMAHERSENAVVQEGYNEDLGLLD